MEGDREGGGGDRVEGDREVGAGGDRVEGDREVGGGRGQGGRG